MTRVRRGYTARRRRTKTRSSFRGARSKLTRTITQQKMKALAYSHRDSGRQKRDFRRLWITRINAVTRENTVLYSYNRLIHNLYKKQLLLNRKIPAQITISNKSCLYMISNKTRSSNTNKVDYKVIYSTGMIETEFPGEGTPGR
uniref:Large ribosomal subunit protein bL20c n=1 Tax=Ravenala madagascariensis TaxID=4664 RepID=U6A1X7_9LILI|nr:ribosomal protein L20 [Ravenala madagascariensis]AHA12622.1 ribosomal protein L20 [Ravenala madagascariensis]AYP34520.1 ribosomal protein L20 [Ravenala madagascariensis]